MAKYKERTRAKRSRDDAGDLAEDVDGTHMHTFLHGGVITSARVVWSKELLYLHVSVDEFGDSWAKLFKSNHDSDDRATSTEHPGVPTSKFSIDVNVDDQTVVDTDVTADELGLSARLGARVGGRPQGIKRRIGHGRQRRWRRP